MDPDLDTAPELSEQRHLLALPLEIRHCIWQYSCSVDGHPEYGPVPASSTSLALTHTSQQIREETLELHYRLNSFRLSICQFSDWLKFIGAYATKLTHVRLVLHCVCSGSNIYKGSSPCLDRHIHLTTLFDFCLRNPSCGINFYHPQNDTLYDPQKSIFYRPISNGQKKCRVRAVTRMWERDKLLINTSQNQQDFEQIQMKGVTNRGGGAIFYPAAVLLYDVIQDIRAYRFAWERVFREGIITRIDLPDFSIFPCPMDVYVDYSLSKTWSIEYGLTLERMKLIGRANIVLVEGDEPGIENPQRS